MLRLKWKPGRLGTGYDVYTIIDLPRFDVHILRMCEGAYIPEHTDKIDGFAHNRMNIVLRRAKVGGQFICREAVRIGRITFFRPDTAKHCVTQVHKGRRYALSIGWASRYRGGA